MSQFDVAPMTFVKTIREASSGSPRYGSRSGGILLDIVWSM